MRQWLVVVAVALAGCSGPSVAEAPKSDAVFLSRKPVDGVAECITWGWGHQKFDDVSAQYAQYSSKAIQNGVRIASNGGAEHLDVVDIQGKTELNLFLAEKRPDSRDAKRIAVIESCL